MKTIKKYLIELDNTSEENNFYAVLFYTRNTKDETQIITITYDNEKGSGGASYVAEYVGDFRASLEGDLFEDFIEWFADSGSGSNHKIVSQELKYKKTYTDKTIREWDIDSTIGHMGIRKVLYDDYQGETICTYSAIFANDITPFTKRYDHNVNLPTFEADLKEARQDYEQTGFKIYDDVKIEICIHEEDLETEQVSVKQRLINTILK